MDTPISFGLWLKQRRKALDMTQADLARCAGCSVVAIRKIEADERRPSRQMAELFAVCLQISPEEQPTFLKVARAELRVERLAGPSPDPESRPASVLSPASNLPAPATPLLGREAELAAMARLLGNPQCRLLTLTGPGGIGKTHLAIEGAAHQRQVFADGVYFVNLASLSSADFIAPAIAEAIDFTFYGSDSPQTQLLNYLSKKQILLLLDNFEHLLPAQGRAAGGALLVADLLPGAPQVKLLVTSRERLNVEEEWLLEIEGLPFPEEALAGGPAETNGCASSFPAVALFVDCGRRVHPEFELTPENQADIGRICRLMEGMPLGIKLAAAWVRLLSCREIVQEIEHNLDFLTTNTRNVPARLRSLRAAFNHSWGLLSKDERRVLRRLSVFRGGFGREAAGAVAGASLPILSTLVDKSLLHRPAAGRYSLHFLIGQYAAERLAEDSQEESLSRDRHSHYYLTLLHERQPALQCSRQKDALAELNADIDNIRTAWDFALARQRIDLIGQAAWPLWYFYELHSYFQEGEATLARAAEWVRAWLAAPDSGSAGPDQAVLAAILGELLAHQAYFSFRQGHSSEAVALFEASLSLLRPLPEPARLAHTLAHCGAVCWLRGQFDEAAQYLHESLPLSRALNHPWQLALFTAFLGVVSHEQGDYMEAYRLLNEALARCQSLGDPRLLSFTGSFLSRTLHALGQVTERQDLLLEGLQLAQETGDQFGIGLMLERLALAAQARQDYAEARRLFEESIELYRQINDPWSLSRALTLSGRFALVTRNPVRARACFGEAASIALAARANPNALDALALLAELHAQEGGAAAALEVAVHILQHPASTRAAREQAERLVATLAVELSPQRAAAIQAQALAKSFEAAMAEFLADCDF